MSIRAKVIGCFAAILCLFGSVSIYGYLRARDSSARLALVNELFLPLSRQVAQLQSNLQGAAEDIHRFYFRSDASPERSTFSRMVRDLYPYLIRKKLASAEQLLAKHEKSDSAALVTELQAMIARSRTLFDRLFLVTDRAQFEDVYRDIRHQLQAISVRLDDECQSITLTAQREANENLISGLVLSALVGLFGLITVFLSHRVLEPLPNLIACIKRIADGDFDQSIKVRTSDKDEISLLAREYNRMLAALSERDKKIQLQQKELLQSERLAAIGQLSAEVVHEIRNPLNAISLNIDWLENELQGSDDEVAKTLRSISREISRLHQITESYLVRARTPLQEQQKTGVNEVIREIVDFSREEDRSRHIEVVTELSPAEVFVRTDRARMKQALLNVLKNAKEAMPRGGKLTIKTEARDNVYRIEIADSGYGMNEATRARTFHPFFTTKPNGTGIGLTLTKSIVEEAQGTIQCESQIGRGTTFTLQFPV